MKRIFSLMCAALLLTGCAGKEPAEPTDATLGTKTVFVHQSITQIQGQSSSRTDYLYDESSRLSDVIVSDEEGNELQRYLVACDENSNPIEWSSASGTTVLYTYDASGRTLGTETYRDDTLMTSTQYNWSGTLRVSVTVKTATVEQRTEYTYDEKGYMTRQDLYTNGVLSSYGLYTHTDEGKPAQCRTYGAEGNPLAVVIYEYDGSTEKRTTEDLDGSVLQTQILTYDNHGNLLQSDLLDQAGALVSSEIHEWMPIEVPADHPRAGI